MSNSLETGWLQNWRRQPRAKIRLFCFSYAGGGASMFRAWQGHLPQEVEVCPVQLPGREGRLLEPPFTDLRALVEELAIVLPPFMDMPYALFGHSMGALVSFELVRYLRRTALSPLPLHLFVSGRRAPQIPRSEPQTFHLPVQEFIEELRRLQGTPEAVLQNEELLHLLIPLLRADFSVCETYVYTHDSPLPCPITAMGGLYDAEVTREMVAAWKKQTSSTFKLRFFDGGHFFLHKEQDALLTTLLQDLFKSYI